MELVCGLLLWGIACPLLCGVVAKEKGYDVAGWVVIGFFLGIFAVIWILVLSPNQQELESRSLASRDTKRCPHCAEHIRIEAKICRYCGRSLTERGD